MSVQTLTAHIASGQSVSSTGLQITGSVVGLIIPNTFTADQVSFQFSPDNVLAYAPLVRDGNEVSFPPQVGKYSAFTPDDIGGGMWLKIQAGTSGAPVVQPTALDIIVLTA
jgi:hypothetical protein